MEQAIARLQAQVDQLQQRISMYTLSNPTSNYASPLDAFYTRAGSLPAYMMTIPYFSLGPNGAFTVSNNNGSGGGGIFSITGSGPYTINWDTCTVTYEGVQYPIASGSSTLQFVTWKINNPNVFTPLALAGLTLGIDDFIVVENNGAGQWSQAFDVERSDGGRWVIIGDSIFLLSASGTLLMDLDQGASGQGLIEIRNSAGAVTLRLDGQTGIITSNGTAITVP